MQRTTFSRRSFLANASLLAAGMYGKSLFAQSIPSCAIVRTPSGTLRGVCADGVRIFRGVPFAEPPIGPLRFKPSIRIKPWKGERDATHFSSSPMQSGEKGIPHSEDSLYLNIWAPQGKGPFPVYIWIHGGGFTGGHAFEPMYDGSEFAREGIVCISVAYRLGVFGFLDWEPLLGAEYAGSANNALRDLMTALEWVQDNIAAFGGDPARVTIGGESAGAKLTDILMGIPSAQPLFHQMISESGGAERVWSRSNSEAVAKGFGEAWRKSTGKSISSLRTAAAASLIDVQQPFLNHWPQHFPLRAQIDDSLLRRFPVQTIAAGNTRGKRLLIGTNRDESALFIGPHPVKEITAANLGNMSLEKFRDIYRKYKNVYPHFTEEELRIRALTAEEYWVPSIRVADAHVRGGGNAWMYRLDFTESSGYLRGRAYHSLDVGMVWDKPHTDVNNAKQEAALARQMHLAWVAFIHGEAPSAPGLPEWPRYSGSARSTMILDIQSHVEQRPQESELRLWDRVL